MALQLEILGIDSDWLAISLLGYYHTSANGGYFGGHAAGGTWLGQCALL